MAEPRFFVAVFGDPNPDKDRVESGSYTAELGYPPFDVEPGDKLLLYCTGSYSQFPMKVPGYGTVLSATRVQLKYEWKAFDQPLPRRTLLQEFDPEDRQKMSQLRFNVRRVFQISQRSFRAVLQLADEREG